MLNQREYQFKKGYATGMSERRPFSAIYSNYKEKSHKESEKFQFVIAIQKKK
jgi:hypothetical protein